MNIVSKIMDGVLFVDEPRKVKFMNPAAEDLLGVKSFMAIGKELAGLSGGGELLDAIREDATKPDWSDSARVVEVHDAEQDLLYINLRVSKVLDYRGQNAGTLIEMHDVTVEHKSHQLKNQYLSIVAHELRTPLTGIKTFSTLMGKGTLGPLNEKQSEVVESIREQSSRLEHQIDKLINLGHIEANQYGQHLEVITLEDLTAQIADPFEQPAADRGIKINVEYPNETVSIEGDRADLKRALHILIENAVKFCRDGGRVLVRAEESGGTVEFVVRDDGPGIDPRYHRRIFEKFFQVEDPLTRHYGGSGLGLFFVESIVQAHGSEVTVDSNLGSGATFSFQLPIYESPGVAAASCPETSPRP